ncbi:MAG: hypothetical protein ABW110_08185 [Steroidobacteraceae bacterium]
MMLVAPMVTDVMPEPQLVASDLRDGSFSAPDFASGLKTRVLLDAIERSANGAGRIAL